MGNCPVVLIAGREKETLRTTNTEPQAKSTTGALANTAQLVQVLFGHRKVMSSIPGQGI